MRCYVASPLGFTASGRDWNERVLLPAIREVAEPVDPWSLTTAAELEAAQREGRAREMALECGRRNSEAIRSSDVLVALLDGQELDSGTAAEVGYACALGLPCFGLRTDLRRAGEEGMSVNLQVEAFVVESGGVLVESVDELISALRRAA